MSNNSCCIKDRSLSSILPISVILAILLLTINNFMNKTRKKNKSKKLIEDAKKENNIVIELSGEKYSKAKTKNY